MGLLLQSLFVNEGNPGIQYEKSRSFACFGGNGKLSAANSYDKERTMIWQLVVIFLICYWWMIRWQSRHLRHFANQHKNDLRKLPLVGTAWHFVTCSRKRGTWEMLETFKQDTLKQGGITAFWLFHRMYVGVADPVIAEIVLKNCLNKGIAIRKALKLCGNSVATADVPIWRPRRRVLAPTFKHSNLKHYVDIFSKLSVVLANRLQVVAEKGSFPVYQYVGDYSLDSLCETSMGVIPSVISKRGISFLQSINQGPELVSERIMKPWLHFEFIYKLSSNYREYTKSSNIIHNFVDEVIQSKRDELATRNDEETNEDYLRTFLELMIGKSETASGYTNEELREETTVMLMAGTHTTALSISFTLTLLARHPDVQEEVYKELQDVFGSTQRPVVADDLPHLHYLEAVVNETLRLYPAIPAVIRQNDEDILLPSGTTLPKGAGVVVSFYATNRNPKYWGDDAELFKPQRFVGNNLKYPGAFQTFSSGPRDCIGRRYAVMSMKTALATLLRRYRVLPTSPAQLGKPITLKSDMFLGDVDDFKINLKPRF